MNMLFNISTFFVLFLCSMLTYGHYHVINITPSWANQTSNTYFKRGEYRSCDYSSDNTYNIYRTAPSYSKCYYFNKYNEQNFHDYFTYNRYTEQEILDYHCLYMNDEFVKFAQTYPCYKSAIEQLHNQLKRLNAFQKAYRTIKGTYCVGLQKRIDILYNQLSLLKVKTPLKNNYTRQIDCSIDSFHQNHAEYRELKDIYHEYTPLLSKAVDKRIDTFKRLTDDDSVILYEGKSYKVNKNTEEILQKYDHNKDIFTYCYGNQLHHILHQESLDLIDHINCLPYNSILFDHQKEFIDFTVTIAEYTHANYTDKAMNVADLCWTLLDYGQAIAEGVIFGAYCAVADIVNNPIEATINIVAGKQILAY